MNRDFIVQGAPESEVNTDLYCDAECVVSTLDALVDLGMAFWSEVPDFPESSHLTRDDFTERGEPRTERARLYEQARQRTLTDHGSGDADYLGGIASHKFSSADGWHVTDKECLEALDAYERSIQDGTAHPEALTVDVIGFLRTAATYEGFRVY